MSLAISNTVSNYTYTYKNRFQPTLDKDSNGLWSRTEVQNYADSYKKATGTALDVDKIMEKYADADGNISYENQNKIVSDDALGLNALYTLANPAKSTSSSTAAPAKSAAAITSTVKEYTLDLGSKLIANLDKDRNGVWSREEVQNYADSYKNATGATLDVDQIMKDYAGEDGSIGYAGQNAISKGDALGLAKLNELNTKAKAEIAATKTTTSAASKAQTNTSVSSLNLADLMGKMSASGKASFALGIQRNESMSTLLDNFGFGSSSNMFSSILSQNTQANMYKIQMQYGSSNGIQAMSNQLMNLIA